MKSKDKIGIFDFLKKKMKITTADNLDGDELVYLHTKNVVKIGSNIFIKPNEQAFIMIDEDVGDIFYPGNNRVVLDNIPLTMKLLKNKFKNNEKALASLKDSFPADIYIVASKEFVLEDAKTDRFSLQKKDGTSEFAKILFDVKFHIKDTGKFLQILRQETAVIKKGEAQAIIRVYIAEILANICETDRIFKEDFQQAKADTEEYLKTRLDIKLENYGLKTLDLKVKEFIGQFQIEQIKQIFIPKKAEDKSEQAGAKIQTILSEASGYRPENMVAKKKEFEFVRVAPFGSGNKPLDVDIINANVTRKATTFLNIDTDGKIDGE